MIYPVKIIKSLNAALFLTLWFSVLLDSNISLSQSLETKARHALMIDMETNTVIFEKAADVPMPPASMSKLMTIYMIFEKLKAGKLNLKDRFIVSEKAWRKGGSKMFVRVNRRVTVENLLRGIIVQSGNDACIVIAEGLAGSEEAFADEMNNKAAEIGLKNSQFKNATGWPAKGHYMSARDLAILSTKLIKEFPDYYPMFAEKNFRYSKIKQGNRNPLLYRRGGADGLKTGHTEASGYGLTASARRQGRRLLLVVNGLNSSRERASEATRVLDWGFQATKIYRLFKNGEPVGEADTWLGKEGKVPLVVDKNITITMPRLARANMKVKLIFNNPIPAPVSKGTVVGRVLIKAPGIEDIQIPVKTALHVEELGLFGRINAAIKYLLYGKLGS